MASSRSTSANIASGSTRTAPEFASVLPGGAPEATVRWYIDAFYALTRSAVDAWGGPIALSSQLETAMSGISDRLHRREVKGALQRAFVDYLAIACTHPAAAELFVHGVCDLLGFERPRRRRKKTEHEKFEALVKSLRRCGALGEAAIERAAKELGADVAEFEP